MVWVVYVGLCGSGNLRGLCGFCVREWLGGLKACGVFAFLLSVFHLLCSCFSLLSFCPALLVLFASLVYLCYLCGSLGALLGFLFPLRTIRKKKGRKGFALCVLSSCVVSVQNLV